MCWKANVAKVAKAFLRILNKKSLELNDTKIRKPKCLELLKGRKYLSKNALN